MVMKKKEMNKEEMNKEKLMRNLQKKYEDLQKKYKETVDFTQNQIDEMCEMKDEINKLKKKIKNVKNEKNLDDPEISIWKKTKTYVIAGVVMTLAGTAIYFGSKSDGESKEGESEGEDSL